MLQQWYDTKAEAHDSVMEILRNFRNFEDYDGYCNVLREVLQLFGDAIQVSFERNIGEWLESTNGTHANSKLSENERTMKMDILCHNNHAGRTFAVF